MLYNLNLCVISSLFDSFTYVCLQLIKIKLFYQNFQAGCVFLIPISNFNVLKHITSYSDKLITLGPPPPQKKIST